MAVQVTVDDALTNLHVSVVEILDVVVSESSSDLIAYAFQVASNAAARAASEGYEAECQAVRQLLRFGKFKASGRSKPAQEYLMRCAVNDGKLPVINGPVDLLNAVSLEANLPISLLSVAKCSSKLGIKRATAGESFIFNSVGQTLELEDLITVYDFDKQLPKPVGTPVKDSMAGKIESTDNHLVAIIYSPKVKEAVTRAQHAADRLARGMKDYCGARQAHVLESLA